MQDSLRLLQSNLHQITEANMNEYGKMIELVEGKLAEAWDHNESGKQYGYIDALEMILSELRNALHAEMLVMEDFAKQFEMESASV